MFLKKSKVHTWICCILGAFLLAAGIWMQSTDAGKNGEVSATMEVNLVTSYAETTEVFMGTSFMETETQEGTYDTDVKVYETSFGENEAEDRWNITSEVQETFGVDSDNAAITGSEKSGAGGGGFSLAPWMGTILLLVGVILSGMYIVLFKQKRPYLGLEAELGLLYCSVIGIWLTVQHANTYISIIYFWLLCIALLVSARGIWGWIWAGLPVKWSGVHRVGLAVSRSTGKQNWYMAVQVVCCIITVVGAMGLFGLEQLQYLRIFPCMLCLVTMALSLVCLMGALGDVEHLTEQIHQMHQGSSVPVQEGLFSKYEEQLVDFNRQHEEAVQTAVTSERFRVDLIANVSHDLRTPLTAILGYGELLKKERLSEEGTKQLTELNRKAGYMRDLVDSLFELTKVSSGVIECKKEQIDLIRLLEQTIGLFDDKLQERNLQIRRHYSVESLPVMTDGARMHQVFANLIGNAIKYTLENTRIHLEVKEKGDCCMVRLVNIASYEMDFQPEEIIQRFARGDKARSTRGSGLGLAIARTYTESVGGSFAVSVDGEQFSAVVTLPMMHM